MKLVAGSSILLVLALVGAVRMEAGRPQQVMARTPGGDPGSLVARGEYLANRVAMCVQCHSSRDEHGTILDSQKFRGGAIPVRSPYQNREWAFAAPSIAGLPGFTDDQIVALLTEGQATDRQPPRPPMPPFRMAREDAQAIVAYLRSR
jgi:mono/diheme cytochrome c family protein